MNVIQVHNFAAARFVPATKTKSILVNPARRAAPDYGFADCMEDALTGTLLLAAALFGSALLHYGVPACIWRAAGCGIINIGAAAAALYCLYSIGKACRLAVSASPRHGG